MKIHNLTENRHTDFFEFNRKVYPRRKEVVERFNFQFLGNPLLQDKSGPHILIACDADDQIIGQMGAMPLKYHFENQIQSGFCGCDFFVLEEYRKKGVGGFLKFKSMKEFEPWFSIGMSEDSKKLLVAAKAKRIGSVYSMIWFRGLPSLIKSAYWFVFKKENQSGHKQSQLIRFPEFLSHKSHTFKKISSLGQREDIPWKDGTLMFTRSSEFITWRFLNEERYAIYVLEEDNSTYFAVRKIKLLGSDFLAIVDYRVPFEDKETFESIVYTSKKMAKILGCQGILTMSSHVFFDKLLKGTFFVKVGTEHEVFTKAELPDVTEKVLNREFVYATMADSDLEFSFW
jgi:hypothetical protein